MPHRRVMAIAMMLLVAVAGCGAQQHHQTTPKPLPLPPAVVRACPAAANGHGSMGECAPAAPSKANTAGAKTSSASTGSGIRFPDFSNNDPCVCGAALHAHRFAGEIDKANQGIVFLDGTFRQMVRDARQHGLAVGGYDFDQEYTAAETRTFIVQLHAAGIYRSTRDTFPPTLDVEYGLASRHGLEGQLAVLLHEYGRAQVYTGAWYWLPHFGCWVPAHVVFWLSGYPTAQLLCGLNSHAWIAHQYTEHGYTGAGQQPYADLSVFRGSRSQFAVYIQALPDRHELEAQLAHLYRERAGVQRKIAMLSALLTKYGCRPPFIPHVVLPGRELRRYHVHACPAWKAHGDASHAHLTSLQKQIAVAKTRLGSAK